MFSQQCSTLVQPLPSIVSHFNGAWWINILPQSPLIISELTALCQHTKWLPGHCSFPLLPLESTHMQMCSLWTFPEPTSPPPLLQDNLHSFSSCFICRGGSPKLTSDVPHSQLKWCLRAQRKDDGQSLHPSSPPSPIWFWMTWNRCNEVSFLGGVAVD